MKLLLADSHARPLTKSEVAQLLARPKILRLAYFDERGDTVVHPVWYYYSRNKFFVATDMESAKARALRKNSSVYFLVDESPTGGPTRGVRGRDTAKVVDEPGYATNATRRNVLRYLGGLKS
jgi:general stress protein 26